jgi:hypothetical protein
MQMGGLRETLGWDNIDSILLENLGWKEVVLPESCKTDQSKRSGLYHKTGRLLRQIFLFLGLNRVLAYIASSKEAMKVNPYHFSLKYHQIL